MASPSRSELSRLRWQCRRGVKELDVVLSDYLDNTYSQASKEEQRTFQAILNIEDPTLLTSLFGETPLKDPQQSALFIKIKSVIKPPS